MSLMHIMTRKTADLANLIFSDFAKKIDVGDIYLLLSRQLSGKIVSLLWRARFKSISRMYSVKK